MHDETCAYCRHRIFLNNGRWQLVYKLYDGDTTICQARGGFEEMEPHRPMGLTDVPEPAMVAP